MIGLLVYYRINIIISVVLASFVFYLIFFKSPKNMTNFKWHLLNVQMSTFVETFYWCFFSAPDPLNYPFFHTYSTGILSAFVPCDAQVGFAIFLLGKIIGALCISLVFRYRALMPHSDTPWIQSLIRILPTFSVILGYGNGFLYGFLTYMSFLNKEETKEKLHQTDSKYAIPEGAVSIGGSWIYPWGGLVISGYLLGTVLCLLIGNHSWKILSSQRSRTQNIEVFKSIALQTCVLYGIIAIPCSIIPGYLMFQSEEYAPFVGDTIFACCAAVYTLKSILVSVLTCYTIRPYREFIIGIFRPQRRINMAFVSVTK